MTDDSAESSELKGIVARCQVIFAHAWMVRTFIKHSEAVEDFPELMQAARTVFDVSRALECHVDDPPAYLAMLRKKLGKLRQAAEQFRHDAPIASDHTNFRQAVISLDGCVAELETLIKMAPAPPPPRAMPDHFRTVGAAKPPITREVAAPPDEHSGTQPT